MKLKSVTGKNLLWLPLVTTLVVSVAMVNVASASPETYFFVDPPEVSDIPSGEAFLIHINVTEAPESYAWEIHLGWDPALLELVYIAEGDFLHRWNPNPFPPPPYVPKYETVFVYVPLDEANVAGKIEVGCSLMGDVPWASGDGGLVSLGFTVEAEGSCVLDLLNTRLYDYILAGYPAFTYYPNQDCFFYNTLFHDIAVDNVAPDVPEANVGESVTIDVTVTNEGDYSETSETFDVTVYADINAYNYTYDTLGRLIRTTIDVGNEVTVGTQTVTEPLAPDATTTLTFTWDTTGIAGETHTISATATSPTEDDPRDNMFIDDTVTVRWDHDLKITDVTVLTGRVDEGELAKLTVTVLNQGTNPESFALYVNASDITIYTTSDSLSAGDNTTYEISWDTTGVATGTYTISAYVPPVSGEVDPNIADNLFVDGTVAVTTKPPALAHDVAVTSVTAPTEATEGDIVTINVDVANPGDNDETFDLAVTYDTSSIETRSVFLASKGSKTEMFSWNTADVTPNPYTITAEAILDTDEDLTNNEASTPILIKTPGGWIGGTVTDASTGDPIDWATVTANGHSATTDSSGAYVISDVPAGTYTVEASAAGYQSDSQTGVTVVAGETTPVDFQLTPTELVTYFWVDPPEVRDVQPGDIFLISINVTEAPESYAWEIHLGWDPALLELIFVAEGDFLYRWMPNPFPPPPYVPKYNTAMYFLPLAEANLEGEIKIGCSLIGGLPMDEWASGDGWLCSLGFTVEAEGSCVLDLHETRLWDHMFAGFPASTYYPNQDGSFCAPSVISVYVDIKPGSWPNPLQLKGKGVLPVAVCGTEDFDVTTVDPSTVQLTLEGVTEGVPPLRWSYEDAATPYTGEPCSGHNLEGDGYLDLTLKFKTREVIETLGLDAFSDRDVVILILTGNLKEEHGGTPIQGQYCIVILN